MSVSLTTPITGSAQTGFTAPTYTIVTDTAPAPNAKQWAVTGIGGTQTGVDVHSVSKPFTLTFFRPLSLKMLPPAAVSTGIIPPNKIGKNVYLFKVRKGAAPAANQIPQVAELDVRIAIPAGTDTYEPEDIRAAISCLIGSLTQFSAGLGDTAVTGVA